MNSWSHSVSRTFGPVLGRWEFDERSDDDLPMPPLQRGIELRQLPDS